MIFQIFQQVDSSETRSYSGLGIGLYIAKTFTEMLGGKIEVQSVPGKGSVFSVILPVRNEIKKDLPKDDKNFSKARSV